ESGQISVPRARPIPQNVETDDPLGALWTRRAASAGDTVAGPRCGGSARGIRVVKIVVVPDAPYSGVCHHDDLHDRPRAAVLATTIFTTRCRPGRWHGNHVTTGRKHPGPAAPPHDRLGAALADAAPSPLADAALPSRTPHGASPPTKRAATFVLRGAACLRLGRGCGA